jgi:hypothetical protein
VDEHQKMREDVAKEYGIALFRRYREKEARGLVGYEASWWKRHRKAKNIPFIEDAGGSISYFGYMLCDLLILGKDAVRRDGEGEEPVLVPASPKNPRGDAGGLAIAMQLIRGE